MLVVVGTWRHTGMAPALGEIRGRAPMATVATSPGGSTDTVWIGAASPLLSYTPRKNANAGSSWVTTPQGYSQCEGSDTYTVELCELTCE